MHPRKGRQENRGDVVGVGIGERMAHKKPFSLEWQMYGETHRANLLKDVTAIQEHIDSETIPGRYCADAGRKMGSPLCRVYAEFG